MRVLITNLLLSHRSGTEVVVEQLAEGLRRAGHEAAVLVSHAGEQAAGLRWRGHVVCERVSQLPWRPDVIHGHHNMMTMVALAAFPGVPAVFTCHDASSGFDRAPRHPRIGRYIAVDALCRDRLRGDGAAAEDIVVLGNSVDPEAYPRRGPLPPRPGRALILAKNRGHVEAVRRACAEAGLPVDELGHGFGAVSDRLGEVLPEYDVVFATARGALEAAYAGCAVVVCDARGFAGLLTSAVEPAWRAGNFGRAILTRPTSAQRVAAALAAYDPDDAARVTGSLREACALPGHVDALLAIYRSLPPAGDAEAAGAEEGRQLAGFLEDYLPSLARDRPWRALAEELVWTEGEFERRRLDATFDLVAEKVAARLTGAPPPEPAEVRYFPAEAFSGSGGRRDGHATLYDLVGVSGRLAWGPYCAAGAGEYRVEFLVQWLGPAGPEARAVFDVASAASRELAGVELRIADAGAHAPVVLSFRHEHPDELLEFRIAVEGCRGGELRFLGACLSRAG